MSANLLLDKFEAYLRLAGSAELWESRGMLKSFELERLTGSIAGNAEYNFTDWFSLFAEGNILKTYDDIGGGQVLMTTGAAVVSEATDRDLSLAGMVLLKKTGAFSIAGVSMAGGVLHNAGQLCAAAVLAGSVQVFVYSPVLVLSGMAAGIVIGVISSLVISRLRTAGK